MGLWPGANQQVDARGERRRADDGVAHAATWRHSHAHALCLLRGCVILSHLCVGVFMMCKQQWCLFIYICIINIYFFPIHWLSAGSRFSASLLASAMNTSTKELLDALSVCTAKAYIFQLSEDEYKFCHDNVHHAAYNMLVRCFLLISIYTWDNMHRFYLHVIDNVHHAADNMLVRCFLLISIYTWPYSHSCRFRNQTHTDSH